MKASIKPQTPPRKFHAAVAALALAIVAALLWHGAAALDYNWRWGRVPRYFFRRVDGEWVAGPLAEGILVTLQLSAVAAVMAVVIGMLAAAAAAARRPALRLLAKGYASLMRATPLFVQLYLLYFLLGNALPVPGFWAGAMALALFEGAFAAEIFRSGFASVPAGQHDAAAALGLPPPASRRLVVLPQALPLMLPPLANLCVSLVKHSSIATIIAIPELTDATRNLVSDTFLAFELWLAAGFVYLLLCVPPARAIAAWERRLRARR